MVAHRPDKEGIRQGITVEIVQEQENNDSEPIIGEVGKVLTEESTHPDGIKVQLKSGATGRVTEIGPEEDDRDVPQGGG